MHQLLAAHLQAENADREFLIDRDVLGDVHGERCLSHAWAGRDHDHFRRVQTAGHPIEFDEAAGDTSDTTFALIELLDRLDCFHHLIFHGKHLAFEAVVAHGENALFYFVEKIIYLVLLLVGAPDALGRSGNDLAQDVFIANDLQVVLKIRRRRNERK